MSQRYHQATASVSIMQRARGVYLCRGTEDQHGTEEWEATSSLAAAKRWGVRYLNGPARPRWEEHRSVGHWPRWYTEITFDGDPVDYDTLPEVE